MPTTLTDAVNTLVTNTTALQTTVSGRITDMDGKIASADNAKIAAEAAKAGAEVAKSAADTAKTDAITAQTLAENAKVAAESAQGIAATAKTDALTAKSDSDTAKNNAIAAQAAAESARGDAQDWATKTSGAVSGGEYSAKYHASAASVDAAISDNRATSATASASTATTQAGISTTKAGEAAASATTATTKASEANTSKLAAATSATAASTSASDAADSAAEATDKAGNTAADAMDSADSAAEALSSASAAAASASAAATTLANKADITYVDSQIGAININNISGDLAVTGGIKLGNDTRTAPTAGAGALRWNATTNKLQNSTGTEWLDVKYEPPGSIGNPVTSTKDLNGEASGVYYINSPAGTFEGYVENTIHGGGWLGVWNLSAHGSSTDKRSYDESSFWSGSTVEGTNADFYTQFYKGASVYKYDNFTEILIVAHDNGGSPPTTYGGGTGGAFGNTYTIKPISSAAVGHTLDWMMSQGNNYVVSTATTSRGGTVGGDGYHRTSGDVFIDEDYNIVFNSTYSGGSDANNNVRFGTNQTNAGDIDLNGHNTGGGYGGKHYRQGNYGLAYTAQPQQGYHNSGTYISYGQAYQNLTGSHTVWGNDASQPSNVLMVDFAIYVR